MKVKWSKYLSFCESQSKELHDSYEEVFPILHEFPGMETHGTIC